MFPPTMFEGFDTKSDDAGKRRRWFASTAVAMLVYAGLGAGVLLFAKTRPVEEEKEIDVSFEKTTVKKEAPKPLPPPPPPPPAAEKPRPKVVKPAPRPQPMIAPKELPKEAPPEKDPGDRAPSGGGEGVEGGVPGGTGPVADTPPPPPPPPPPKRSEPVNLPEEATPPVPAADNAMPVYPEDARKAGKEGQVILKVVVTESGKVANIQVMRGDPPFVDAAIAAVKSWKFEPAMLDGKPIAVFRILKIPFRLSVGG